MRGKMKRVFAAIAAAAGITLAYTGPVAAYTGEAAQQEKTETDGKAGPLEEETPDGTEATPFSMPGNGKLLDDVGEDSTKQFLSVQTKNGNTFYIVVDRSGSTENVYMLSLVDENDLKEFIEEDSGDETAVDEIPEPALDLETDTDTEPEDDGQDGGDEKEEKSTGMGAFPVLLVLGGCAAGLYYYFKVLKPQKEADGKDDEELEFYSEVDEGREDGTENEE